MLNLELIDHLYETLTREQQQELIGRLFRKSKQSMGYFRRTKDISLSKLETLADFFHMPLDDFRKERPDGVNRSVFGGDLAGSALERMTLEINALKKEAEALKVALQAKDETIQAKDEVIDTLRQGMDNVSRP